jgi:hypothetical protein
MGSGTCERCGSEFVFGHDGDDPFTSVSVSYHDAERIDFAASFCQECGDELLTELAAAVEGASE